MQTGNLQSANGRIQEAYEELMIAWEQVKEVWTDQQMQYFEDTYLRRISEELTATAPAIGQISQVYGAAQRECSE